MKGDHPEVGDRVKPWYPDGRITTYVGTIKQVFADKLSVLVVWDDGQEEAWITSHLEKVK